MYTNDDQKTRGTEKQRVRKTGGQWGESQRDRQKDRGEDQQKKRKKIEKERHRDRKTDGL